MSQIILLNKPHNVLSQFTDKESRKTLADCIPASKYPGFYAAGRLDYDSEGLILLTNEGAIQHRIANPKNKLEKWYWAQVEGEASEASIAALQKGVTLKDGITRPAKIQIIPEPPIWPRDPPIRQRVNIPTSWLKIGISEGKNRQVRRMTAAVGLPTLRLIRFAIGDWHLQELKPGEYRSESLHLPPTPTKKNQSRYPRKKKTRKRI